MPGMFLTLCVPGEFSVFIRTFQLFSVIISSLKTSSTRMSDISNVKVAIDLTWESKHISAIISTKFPLLEQL